MNYIYIAGASSRAQTAKVYLEFLYPGLKVRAFLVSPDMDDNSSVIGDVPVMTIQEGLQTEFPVYIGTRGINHSKIEKELRAVGFTDIRPITVRLDIELRNAYVGRVFKSQGRVFQKMSNLSLANCSDTLKTSAIYVANSVFDGILKDKYDYLHEEKLLQVGTSLTSKRIERAEFFDNTGDNISNLNRTFCELTGLYWIWKNAAEDYVGLAHYRRHFLLPEKWIQICESEDIDVILPVPLYVAPSIAENYRNRHEADVWDYLMEYLRNELPEEYDEIVHFFEGNLYSPCNMLISKKEVLDDLCSWMFPIIFAVVEHIGEKEDSYQRRYPGFMSERLITYFFESRKNIYKVVYCDKNFLC